jgi:uncharacterized membrane protein YgcG
MDYNTTRTQMHMPEYGRNVQRMAEYLLTIEDRAQRLKNAEAIIEVMAILNPHLKQIEDYRHKLWDHLHQMTDFKLDVDSPYAAPTAEDIRKKPEVLPYPKNKITHRHLGVNLQQVLEKALEETDEEKRQGYTQHLGYYIKLAYATWHKEPVGDDMVKNELNNLSKGALQYEPNGFRVQVDIRPETVYGKRNKKNRNYVQPGQTSGNNSGGGNNGGGGNAGGGTNNNNFKKRKYNNNNKNRNKSGGGAMQ